MIVSEKKHQNSTEYIHFSFKKRFEVNKERIISGEKIRNSGNYIYDYDHSIFERRGFLIQCVIQTQNTCGYEWVKRKKFLLAVIYR